MTTYSAITAPEIAQDAPVTQPLMQKVRDNPIAMMEGASGAPRLELSALPRLVAGNSERGTVTATTPSSGGAGSISGATSFAVLQGGTLRLTLTHSGSAGSRAHSVTRTRNGSSSTLLSGTGTSPVSVDVTLVPGDLVGITIAAIAGASSQSAQTEVKLKTDGGDLWPLQSLSGLVTGNAALS